MVCFIIAIVSLIVGALGGFVGGVLVYRNNSEYFDSIIDKIQPKS